MYIFIYLYGSAKGYVSKIQELQADICRLKKQSEQSSEILERTRSAVVGGLDHSANGEEACEWLKQTLWDKWMPQPTKMFVKGEFKGRVWAKFGSEDDRNEIVAKLRSLALQQNDKIVWAKPDLPIELRVVSSALFGVKWLLSQWGKWERQSLWVDVDEGTLKVGDELIMMAWVHSGRLEKKFGDGWAEYLQSAQLDKIVDGAAGKLQQSQGPTKGVGKGKNKSGKDLSSQAGC